MQGDNSFSGALAPDDGCPDTLLLRLADLEIIHENERATLARHCWERLAKRGVAPSPDWDEMDRRHDRERLSLIALYGSEGACDAT